MKYSLMNRHLNRTNGFSRMDLMTATALVALLGALGLPVLANLQSTDRSVMCLGNLRQLGVAWLAYAADHNGTLVHHDNRAVQFAAPWAIGWLDWSSNSDNTNTANLIDPERAKLARYGANEARLFKCPSDQYSSIHQTAGAYGLAGRVRSYSMNVFVGDGSPPMSSDLSFKRLDQFISLPPNRAFVLLDEHADGINDTTFYVYSAEPRFVDYPAAYHEGAGSFSFADGHAERHQWRGTTFARPVQFSPLQVSYASAADYPDYLWLKDHATTQRRDGD